MIEIITQMIYFFNVHCYTFYQIMYNNLFITLIVMLLQKKSD